MAGEGGGADTSNKVESRLEGGGTSINYFDTP